MDKVRLVPLERAELEDVRALQTLVYEHLQRHTGQLLGAAYVQGGLLSATSPSFNNVTDELSFQSFAFCSLNVGNDTSDGTTRTPIARVIRFDSGAAGHIGYPVDTSAMQQGSTYILYARAASVDSDSEQRRQFSVATGLEEPLIMNTRERECVEFSLVLSTVAPSGSNWVKILEIVKSLNGGISYTAHTLWDDANSKAVTRLENRIPQIVLNTSELVDNVARFNSHTLGLVEMLALMRLQIARILYYGQENDDPIASDTSERWTDRPLNSLEALSFRAASLENGLASEATTRAAEIEELQRVKRIYARYYFRWTSTENTVNITLYDETGDAQALLSGEAINGTVYSMGDVGITSQNFIRCSKRPVINLSSATNTWHVIDHNIVPVLALPYASELTIADSFSTGSGIDLEPIPFSYALRSNNNTTDNPRFVDDLPEGLITSEGVEPAPTVTAPSIIPRTITPFYNAQNINVVAGALSKAVPFALSVDPVAYSAGQYSYCYDVMLTVRRA